MSLISNTLYRYIRVVADASIVYMFSHTVGSIRVTLRSENQWPINASLNTKI